jgi:hypothetical protein
MAKLDAIIAWIASIQREHAMHYPLAMVPLYTVLSLHLGLNRYGTVGHIPVHLKGCIATDRVRTHKRLV